MIFNELKFEDSVVKFYSHRSGDLGVTRDGDRLVLDFPAFSMDEIEPIHMLERAETKPIKYWESQGNMLFLLLEDQKAVEGLEPDMHDVLKLPYDEVIVTAKGDDCDFASRMFAPRIGIPEDPVTGAIHCSLIPYWAAELGKEKLFARQISKRGGELYCELNGNRVKIGGNAVLYMRGEIYVEAENGKRAGA